MVHKLAKQFICGLWLIALYGCASPAYYGQAISGHLKLMRERAPIDAWLQDNRLDQETKAKLRQVEQIRQFAFSRLQLPASDSYTEYVQTHRAAVVWNVVAAPEFSLVPKRWCFPFAGCVPYRGYFKQTKAQQFAEKLRHRGLDVTVSPATAYSTLGWFADPVLDTMLAYSETQLAALLIHELSHQKLYLAGDTPFNESFASFIEQLGTTLWLKESAPEQFTGWLEQQEAKAEFTQLVRQTKHKLGDLYSSSAEAKFKASQKRVIIDQLRADYDKLKAQHWGGRGYYDQWLAQDLNNANFILFSSYENGLCQFAKLYNANNRNLAEFYQELEKITLLTGNARQQWLDQPCQYSVATLLKESLDADIQ